MAKKRKLESTKIAINRGRFQKGQPKIGGRKKGSHNKLTHSAKEAFKIVFDKLGGANGLFEWAKTNKDEFYKLYSKLVPIDVANEGGASYGGIIIINGKEVTET